jgi:hypothetical protein
MKPDRAKHVTSGKRDAGVPAGAENRERRTIRASASVDVPDHCNRVLCDGSRQASAARTLSRLKHPARHKPR